MLEPKQMEEGMKVVVRGGGGEEGGGEGRELREEGEDEKVPLESVITEGNTSIELVTVFAIITGSKD
jgi:hypothetical protein